MISKLFILLQFPISSSHFNITSNRAIAENLKIAFFFFN